MILIRNDRFGAPIETFGIYTGRQRAKKTHTKEHTQTLINSHLQQFFFHARCTFPPFGGETNTDTRRSERATK